MSNIKYIPESEILRQKEFIDRIRVFLSERQKKSGRPFFAMTQTFGCQQNENDTERINGMLEEMGFLFTKSPEEADFILYNTCAVRDHAEQKVYGKIGALAPLKRDRPCVIALCGCMMQQPAAAETIRTKYRHVDLLFGPHALYRFPENLWKVLQTGERIFDNAPSDGAIAEGIPLRRGDRVRAWVSIMSGCNNFCTYCIVPYVRGRERSRTPEAVLAEVRDLVRQGYREITLLGQNVNSYCSDLTLDYDFADLLREIDGLKGDFTVRFMTSHPKDVSQKMLDVIGASKHISRHIHLPFQSGSNRILKLMNRRYTREDYLDLIRRARETIPDAVFTSDVIVGFPTETEEDFQDTLSLIREVGFDGLFTFLYSPRNGTPAAAMADQIPDSVKSERYARLSKLQSELSEEANSRRIGQILEVMVTGRNRKNPMYTESRTDDNKIVLFESEPLPEGTKVAVKIERALNWAMFGSRIEVETKRNEE